MARRPIMSEDVRWLLDRYILLLNAKLRERGCTDEPLNSIVGAIVAQFLIENQREILDEYKLYIEKKLGRSLTRLGFEEPDIACVGDLREQATGGTGGGVSEPDGGQPSKPAKVADKFRRYRTRGFRIARRVADGNEAVRILTP